MLSCAAEAGYVAFSFDLTSLAFIQFYPYPESTLVWSENASVTGRWSMLRAGERDGVPSF